MEDDETLSSYFPSTETVLNTISECILELLRLQSMFYTRSQFSSDFEDESDDMVHEIDDIKDSVVRLIEELFMDPKGGDNSPPFYSSNWRFPANGTAFTFIYECIQELVQMQCCVHQMAISLSHGESVEKEQQEVLGIKSSFVLRIDTLFRESQAWRLESCDESTTSVESSESFEIESTDEDEDECAPFIFPPPVPLKEFIKEEFKWSSVNESETEEKERYLCLSNGYEIWCLDLKRSLSNQPELPKIATLSLLGEQLPASVGLFKYGSDAYLIGGQELPPPSGFQDDGTWGEVPVALSHYKSYCDLQGIKASSCLTYRLSLTPDKEDDSLSLSPKACSDFVQELNKPKFWPIVEKIDEKLHVMDSVPCYLLGNREWIFTHEVHDLRG